MASVLLLEDERALRALLREALEDAGHDVVDAPDGRAARDPELVAATDVMVTDLMMPLCDGLEAIRSARAIKASVGIVAMSGGGRRVTTDFLPLARELGADSVLYKPFLTSEMIEAVARAAGKAGGS
ncbi:MAG: response regulator transcription factor [Rubrimonas sp.]